MRLTAAQSWRIFEQHGCWVNEACDKCGQALGAVRYTRRGEDGVFCSRECRGIVEQPAIRKGGRPRKYLSDAEKQKAYRQALRNPNAEIPSVTKPPCSLAKTKDLQAQKQPLSHHPLTRPSMAQESPL